MPRLVPLRVFLPVPINWSQKLVASSCRPGDAAVDGDTIQFGDVRLHLEGIDAPQSDQACFDKTGTRWKCGVAARDQLKSLAGTKSWACRIDRKDLFGRQVAKCQAEGEDVARQMVEGGWAMASTTGSAIYLPDEAAISGSGAGLWAGAFIALLDWRQHNWHAKIYGKKPVPARSAAQLLAPVFGFSDFGRLRDQG